MTFEELLDHARRLEGQVLRTLAEGARFRVRVGADSLFYTPESTGNERRHTFKFARRVFDRFVQRRSFKTVDYADISKNASYMLAVISSYTESAKQQGA